jgi:hypothetical protein
MSSVNPADRQPASTDEVLTERVAELAGELAEAQDETRRQRLARQIAQLGGRRGQVTGRGFRTGREGAWQRLQTSTGAAVRRVRPATAVAQRRASATGAAARKGAQTSTSVVWRGVRASGQWLTAQVLAMAPKIPIRDLATLEAQHPGLDTEQLADALIIGAARASGGVGAAVGAAAAVPFMLTAPIELGVETMALVGIELKLIAELHEVYGMPAPGSAPQRMIAYVGSWADRRGVRITTSGLALAVGSPLRRKLERRLLAKASKSALALAPLLTGAAAGALIDYRETRKLGHVIRDDLRNRGAVPGTVVRG